LSRKSERTNPQRSVQNKGKKYSLKTAIFRGLGSPTSLKFIEHKIVTTIAITRSEKFLPIRGLKNSMQLEVGLLIELVV
jgi:hypothetical protein